jgi:hypothetical protein
MRRVRRANLPLRLGELAVVALQAEAEGAAVGGGRELGHSRILAVVLHL